METGARERVLEWEGAGSRASADGMRFEQGRCLRERPRRGAQEARRTARGAHSCAPWRAQDGETVGGVLLRMGSIGQLPSTCTARQGSREDEAGAASATGCAATSPSGT